MPSKRQRTPRNLRVRITDAALAAYKAGDRLTLHRELHLKPWQETPLAAAGTCPWPDGSAGATTWADACRLRDELEAA
jgi:hypothetical protein